MSFLIKIIICLTLLVQGSFSLAVGGKLTPVVSPKVCMVTNKVFPTVQIPIAIEKKTYYGCCQMCKQQLAEKPEVRVAIDPYSKETVDKATAYIGADSKGNVFYFKNDDHFKKYNIAR